MTSAQIAEAQKLVREFKPKFENPKLQKHLAALHNYYYHEDRRSQRRREEEGESPKIPPDLKIPSPDLPPELR